LFCENFYSLGCTGPGGFAEYVVVNQDKAFPIKKLSFEQASLTEPTACAIHGMDVIGVQPGDDVLLFGAGPTGIILAQLLKVGGAANLVVAAPTQFKLDIVKTLCADHVIRVDRNDNTRHTQEINRLFPKGFDVVVDATGAASITEHALPFAKYGGKVVIYGVCPEEARITISPYEIFRRELKLIGSFAQTHCFDRALKYLENGIVKVDPLITHTFRLEDYAQALELVQRGKSLKVVIQPNQP
jgi:D-arabinitol dehydrogenase (NADP+)